MGIFDWLFGGDDPEPRTVNTTTTVQSNIPEWLQRAGEEQYETALPLANRPSPIYGGDRIAGFTPTQTEAFGRVAGQSGSQPWMDAFNQAYGSIAGGAAPVGQEDISRYMNPYTQDVIDTTTNQVNRAYNIRDTQRRGRLAGTGSYLNYDRTEVLQGLSDEARARTIAEQTAGLSSAGFQNALQQANADRSRMMAAGGQFANLAPMMSQLGYTDIAALEGVGNREQQLQQQTMNLDYEDFMRQFTYPQEQLDWLQNLMRGVPGPSSTTTTGQQYIPETNTFAQNLGAFGSLAGGIGTLLGN